MKTILSRRWVPQGHEPEAGPRPFRHEWHKLTHHYYRLLSVPEKHKAMHLDRLERLTEKLGAENNDALVIWASRALIAEMNGYLRGAVAAKKRLVFGMRTLLLIWPECPDMTMSDIKIEEAAIRLLQKRIHAAEKKSR